jgi:SAM-dependent methyltransferase
MKCPACFSNNTGKINTYASEGYTFYRCNECEVIFANPMKAGIKDWYENLEVYAIPKKPRENLKLHEESFLKEDIIWKGMRILNIGCGPTVFLKKLEELGCDITAVDINEKIIDFTRNILGVENAFVYEALDFIASYKEEKFDIIIFFELLEHLEDPGEFIRNLKSIIKDDGKIFFSVPNRERMIPSKDTSDYPPHHLTRWNKESLRNFLEIHRYFVDRITMLSDIANDFLWVIGIYFGTLYLEDKIKKGCKNPLVIFAFKFLFKFRVGFYKTIAMIGSPFVKGRRRIVYVVASIKGK